MIALTGDIEIGYDDVGSGIPVLFVHGFPHNRTLWAPQMGALVDHSRCLAIDLRGYGDSTIKGPWSMDQFADDIAGFMDAMNLPPVVLCGISMGGYIAFAFWRRHRARVRALILTDTRATPDGAELVARRREAIVMAGESGSTAVAASQIQGMLGKSTREKHPELVDSVFAMLESADERSMIGSMEAMIARPDSTPTLATIDVPTLVVVGEEDALTQPKEARAMHQAIAGSRLEIIAGAGHLANLERPAAFNHVVGEFLAALNFA